MKSVRLRRLYSSCRGLINPQLRDDLPGTSRGYGAPAFLESESGSEYEASKFPANGRSVSRESKSKIISGNFDSDVGKYLENQVVTLQRATEEPTLLKSEDKPEFLPKALQRPDSQCTPLTTAYVCKMLQDQMDSAQAWQFFIWAGKQQGFEHSIATCNQMIQAFCKHQKFDAVFELLDYMRQEDLSLTKFAFSKIINGVARSGQHEKAVKIFKAVMSSGYRANTVLYNQYLDALVKAGYYDQINAGYAEMQGHGLVPDVYTYTILIKGFGRAYKMQQAWDTYTEMKAQGCPPNEVTCMSLISILKVAGETEKALQVINETFRSRIVPNSFLKVLSSSNTSGNVEDSAPDIAGQAPKRDCDPTASCDERLLSLLCDTQDLDSAMQVLRDIMSQGRMPSTPVYNFVLLSMGRAGKADWALELIRSLRSRGCLLDDISYEATIIALCKVSKADEAFQMKKEMQEQGYVASVEIHKELILHLYKTGQLNRAFEFFSQLQNFEPDTATYTTLMSALSKLDDPSRALSSSE